MNIWYEGTKKDIYLLCQIVILKKSELYRNWYSLSLGILTQDSPGSFLFWKTKLLHRYKCPAGFANEMFSQRRTYI